MPSTFQHMAQSPQPAVGKMVVGSKPDPKPGQVGVKVKAAIFFDGTGNNQSNIKKRRMDSSYMVPHWYSSDTDWDEQALSNYESYEQYYSNVAILYFMHKKKVAGERTASVYMEGIGTSNDGPDDSPGGGFGSGPTGIVDRVTKGIQQLGKEIALLYAPKKEEYLEEVTIYAFGFSRGAAAARHFCARRKDSRGRANNLCQVLRVDAAVVTIKFVGLFDTVSSYDDKSDDNEAAWKWKAMKHGTFYGDEEFQNDVPELHLDFDLDPQVLNVIHLAAAEEYRVNFSLTTIASALRQGPKKGFEIRLPGAHSDIGGGYPQRLPEKRKFNDSTNGLLEVVHLGWTV